MTQTYKPKKKTKGIGLNKGQRLQVTTGKPGVLSAPSKGPSMSREALATVSKHIAPYSDKAKKKIIAQGSKSKSTLKRLSRTRVGREGSLALLGTTLVALVKKFEQAKKEGVSEVAVGGSRFTVSPSDSDDAVTRYLKANPNPAPRYR
tara:strand:- start:558 stop:1001 length:444 start_codon:yes stop_codon:yes gene_type:complete